MTLHAAGNEDGLQFHYKEMCLDDFLWISSISKCLHIFGENCKMLQAFAKKTPTNLTAFFSVYSGTLLFSITFSFTLNLYPHSLGVVMVSTSVVLNGDGCFLWHSFLFTCTHSLRSSTMRFVSLCAENLLRVVLWVLLQTSREGIWAWDFSFICKWRGHQIKRQNERITNKRKMHMKWDRFWRGENDYNA